MKWDVDIKSEYFSVSNASRWQQLRDWVLKLDQIERPDFRSKCLTKSHLSDWDREWSYHFLEGGFKDVEWVELRGGSLLELQVFAGVVDIQFVGNLRGDTLRHYGYPKNGSIADKLTRI